MTSGTPDAGLPVSFAIMAPTERGLCRAANCRPGRFIVLRPVVFIEAVNVAASILYRLSSMHTS